MNQPRVSWPTRPTGITSVGHLVDSALLEVADLLEADQRPQWFEMVQPPETPNPTVDQLPDYDHEVELAAVPEEPTDAYRKQALDYINSVIEARANVRPNSLRPVSEVPDGIKRRTTRPWVWYRTRDDVPERRDDRPKSEAKTTDHGKYLFFTPGEPRVLEDIVVEQFQIRPFNVAKVTSIPNRREDAVLCLYFQDDRYRGDLRGEYQNEPEDDTYVMASAYNPNQPIVKPRGFKTDAATRRGEYSDRFKQASE